MKFGIKKSILIFILMLATIFLVACEEKSVLNLSQDENLKVHFIDVGQGDCELIQLPSKEVILIDGGN